MFVHDTRGEMRVINMSDFRDEAHSSSWDHAGFVRLIMQCILIKRLNFWFIRN